MKISKVRIAMISAALGAGLSIGSVSVEAVPLSSTSLIDVPLPVVNSGDALSISEALASPTDSTTAWTSAVQAPWLGTISQTGALPLGSSNPAGTTFYDFAGLTNNFGLLPVNTFFRIGDLDNTGSETISMTAYDPLGNIITSPWLEAPEYISGPNAANQNAMPDYFWDSAGVYTFDGNGATYSFAGDTNVAFSMWNNVELSRLDVTRGDSLANFLLAAPLAATVPVPGAMWLLFSGLLGLIGITRHKKI